MRRIFLITATLISIVYLVNGQDKKEFISELYLKGKWIAECPVEVMDHATFRYCELCPYVSDKKTKRGYVSEVEITFEADSIRIMQNEKIQVVPCTRNKDNHSIQFRLNERLYHFRLLLYEDKRIMVDEQGMVVVLRQAG